jgi:hypothetical protein
MVTGGDIDRNVLLESFSRIKEDIAKLNSELYSLKLEHKKVMEENLELRKKTGETGLDKETVKDIISETIKSFQGNTKNRINDALLKKLNKKRKIIIKNRIHLLAEQKNLSLPEIKEILVDEEGLCSKATFYRYIELMKKKGLIDFVKINDIEVVAKIN